MSGAFRRIGEYLGLVEDSGRYDDDGVAYAADDDTADHQLRSVERADARRERRPAPVADLANRRTRTGPTGVVAELARITTLNPRNYNEARTLGEQYRDGTPVIMNLSDMDDADAKRLVDFAAGLVFGTHGTIERVTNKVFLLSPHNVTVAAEDKQRIAEGGFFNQS